MGDAAASADADAVLAQNRFVASPFVQGKVQRDAARNWDKFYKAHEDRFFKDRHWTDIAFDELRAPGLDDAQRGGAAAPVLLEVGCGVGNTVYPLLEKNPQLRVHCCDFSPRAIDMVRRHPAHTPERVNAFVCDIAGADPLEPHLARDWPPISVLSLIFVLSAIPPHEHVRVVQRLVALLPRGASVVFRDYARADIAHVRFHMKRDAQWTEPSLLSAEHDWYRRGDNTMAYFFAVDEVDAIGRAAGLAGSAHEVVAVQENRQRGLVMTRRFVQACWRKV